MWIHVDAATFWYSVAFVVGGILLGICGALYASGGIRRNQADRLDDLDAATRLERRRQSSYEREPGD